MEETQCVAAFKDRHHEYAEWAQASHKSMGLCMGIDDDHAFDVNNGHNNFWEFDNLTRLDPESNEIPGWCDSGLDVPKIVIVHGETNIPDWVQLYVSLGGCFPMSMQCFTTHA